MNKIKLLKTPKSSSLIEKTEGVLFEYLISGKIEPNSYLPSEAELCGKLGVGRTTLREAVKVLESKGFVTRRHGKGMQVVDENHRAASDILQLLLIISCLRVAPKTELTREYHKKILEAIEAGNPKRAPAATLEHLKGTEEMLRDAGINEYLV